jgi:NAD+ synthase (glutamine-hydrolysing)
LYTRDTVEELAAVSLDIIINISASPYSFGKRAFRQEMLQAIAQRHGLPVVFANLVGGNDSLVFDGSSLALGAKGEIRAQAKSFEEDLIFFDTKKQTEDIHPQPLSEVEAVYDALVLGTRDYCRKCGFERAVIGLSGGIDSSALTAPGTADGKKRLRRSTEKLSRRSIRAAAKLKFGATALRRADSCTLPIALKASI